MLPEIFVEERKVVEAQGECNFLDRHIGRFKLRFGIHNDDIAQDIQCSPSADLFYHITEMLQGDVEPFGVIRHAMLFRVVFHRQLRTPGIFPYYASWEHCYMAYDSCIIQ